MLKIYKKKGKGIPILLSLSHFKFHKIVSIHHPNSLYSKLFL